MSRRRSITRTLLLVATLFFGARAEAQSASDEAQIKAAFVYNFLKFIEWPAGVFRGPLDAFVVGIIGEGATALAAEQFLSAKLIAGRPLVVRRLKWDAPVAGVQAVFVTERDTRRLQRVFNVARPAAILTIGEGTDFAPHGGVIGLYVENRKVRFDINVLAAEASGLQVSSKLLALSRIVRSTADTTSTAGARP